MRSPSLSGWRITLLVAAVVSLVLLPVSLALAAGSPTDDGGGIVGELQPADKTGDEQTAVALGARFARSNYVWPYATGPYYGDVELSARNEPGVVKTSVGSFRLSEGLRQLPAELRSANKLGQNGIQYFIVQIEPTGLEDAREIIEGRGGVVIGSMSGSALVARLTPAAFAELQRTSKAGAIEPYHAALKLDPTIGRTPLLDPAQAVSDEYVLDLRLFPGENPEAAAAAAAKVGAKVLEITPDTLHVQAHRGKLAELAALEPIQRIWESVPNVPNAEETTAVVQTGRLNGGPSTGSRPYTDAGIDGSGSGLATAQTLMVLDTGIQLDAGDLSDTNALPGTPGGLHRKVRFYDTTNTFGTDALRGDLSGCDTGEKGGFTHGHVVASVALGAATRVPPAYGTGFLLRDDNGNSWRVDGVAPGALLVAYDAQLTPAQTSCADPAQNTVFPGDLYAAPPTVATESALADAYSRNARVFNLSWGNNVNQYSSNAIDIDNFMRDRGDALVFVAAGNASQDSDNNLQSDPGSLSDPATAKNSLAIGASRNSDDLGGEGNENAENRAPFSGVGPAVDVRVAPQLMAPGSDVGETGIVSEFACLTNDNNQTGATECVRRSGLAGTSFSAGAASGAALVVRDYFAQGFYPDGRANNTNNAADQVPNISGAMTKAMLIASANFMNGVGITGVSQFGDNLTFQYRFNNEQGYGRIQLDKALPLSTWPASPSGLLITDGGYQTCVGGATPGAACNSLLPSPQCGAGTCTGSYSKADISGLDGSITSAATDTGTFQICNANEELRVALTWIDPVDGGGTGVLVNNLDLEVQAPSGKLYYGNYFTDDNNRDGETDLGSEDCPGIDGLGLSASQSQWSVPTCANSDPDGRDTANPTEAVMLSPVPFGTRTCSGGANNGNGCAIQDDCPGGSCFGTFTQVETGVWTVRVKGATVTGTQRYAVAIAGGVCKASSVGLDSNAYTCNQDATITVAEFSESGDVAPNAATIQARTKVEVLSGVTVVDTENGNFAFVQLPGGGLAFETDPPISVTDRTVPESNNGVLDVRTGNTIRVTYADVDSGGLPDLNKVRISEGRVNCTTAVGFGNIVFFQLGLDKAFNIVGGCELNRRGMREFGFPDQYMDAGENLSFEFAYASQEGFDLRNAEVGLRCVISDADSPAACRPNSTDCTDPNRANNRRCDQSATVAADQFMSILNSPQTIGSIPATSGLTGNFAIAMADTINCVPPACSVATSTPEVELLLTVSADASGKTADGLAISRQRLNVDEQSLYYNTDFPTGGVEYRDFNNDERINGWVPTQEPMPPLVNSTTPITRVGGTFLDDYRSEAFVWSSMTATGKNLTINSPWNFDISDGGFVSGLSALADEATIGPGVVAQWGEDKNFNGTDDRQCASNITIGCQRDADCPGATGCNSVEQRDPNDGVLDKGWSTAGGCGFVTKATGTCTGLTTRGCYGNPDCDLIDTCDGGANLGLPCPNGAADCPGANCAANNFGPCNTGAPPSSGGAWHTGRIGPPSALTCFSTGDVTSQCQLYETVGGVTGQRVWFEVLETPEIQRVNAATHSVEIVDWQWNSSVGLSDNDVVMGWEVDNNTRALEPVDTRVDFAITNGLRGPYSAKLGSGNARLTDGFPLFQEQCTSRKLGVCVAGSAAGTPCAVNADCPTSTCSQTVCIGGDLDHRPCTTVGSVAQCTPTEPNRPAGICVNGYNTGGLVVSAPCTVDTSAASILGGVRQGKNSCYFEDGGVDALPAGTEGALDVLSLPRPPRDGRDNDGDGTTDEFVTRNGPTRNMYLNHVNGPDTRFTTIEDFYGASGEFFKASIILRNEEKESAGEPDPIPDYGLGVDDAVLMWREFSLVNDTTDCATAGQCATIDLQTGSFFEGRALVLASILENSPDAVNDCNLNGVIEVGEDQDCDNNSVRDLVIAAGSQAEPIIRACVGGSNAGTACGFNGNCPGGTCVLDPTSEIYFANRVGGTNEYRANIPVSNLADVNGTLFIAASGAENPLVSVSYFDNNDGTGSICKNNVNSDLWGRLTGQTTVFLDGFPVVVIDAAVSDNGDNDGWADTNETVSVLVRLRNLGTVTAENVSLRAATSSSAIECLIDPVSLFGDIPPNSEKVALDSFTFKVGALDRTGLGLGPNDSLVANFGIILNGDNFDSTAQSQNLPLDLDLSASGGGTLIPGGYVEDFEADSGLSGFTTQNIDQGKHGSNALSSGYWCQYHNPNDPDANSFGDATCYLGGTPAQTERYHFAIDKPGDVDDSRAYTGTHSLYFGILGPTANTHTTPMGILEGVATAAPINLGFIGDPPVLSWKHQVSLLDDRSVNAQVGRATDRGVAHLQLAATDGPGTPIGDWIKLSPYTNVYDTQTEDNYFNCFFDPIDDGNDSFDITTRPPDSLRIYGPSSTCYPEFTYVYQGDTFRPFAASALGKAQGPPLEGATGIGTWVETKVSLFRFRGRRIRVRFATTGLKAQGFETWEQIFQFNPDPGDDGWWIDDFRVSNALTAAATIVNDNTDNSGLPGCGAVCNTLDGNLTADPASLSAPGLPVTLSALTSVADRCLNGTLQYRFCISADDDCRDSGDTILRGFTDNPDYIDAPGVTTHYAVDVQCSSATSCGNVCPGPNCASAGYNLVVTCPTTHPNVPDVTMSNKTTFNWPGPARIFHVGSGTIANFRVTPSPSPFDPPRAGYPLLNQAAAITYVDATVPPANDGFWYLFRGPGTVTPPPAADPFPPGATLCNEISWGPSPNDIRDSGATNASVNVSLPHTP